MIFTSTMKNDQFLSKLFKLFGVVLFLQLIFVKIFAFSLLYEKSQRLFLASMVGWATFQKQLYHEWRRFSPQTSLAVRVAMHVVVSYIFHTLVQRNQIQYVTNKQI